ncbi:MAG: hypothetical protein O3A37_02670 [Planctomycetota bacterium]|nr:hypothetical protein [Planctomycetota bacterium]
MSKFASLAEKYGLPVMAATMSLVVVGCGPGSSPQTKPAATAAGHDHDGHDHAAKQGEKSGHDDHAHDHDHGEHATHDTLAGALAELEKICATVKEELGKKNLDEADGHVHMVGHLLDDMHRLVDSGKLADDAKAAAKKALDEVFDCFDKLDTALHSSDEKVKEAIDYLEHEPRIQAAVAELKKAAAAVQEGAAKAAEKVEKAAEAVGKAVGGTDADQ